MATTAQTVSSQGISLAIPAGWDSIIFQRPAPPEAPPGSATHPAVHASTIALPLNPQSDFGTDIYPLLGQSDIFLALLEYEYSPDAALFTQHTGIPWLLTASDISPAKLPRLVPGMAGAQGFFSVAGRAFCLFVVLGSFQNAGPLLAEVNAILPSISISPSASP